MAKMNPKCDHPTVSLAVDIRAFQDSMARSLKIALQCSSCGAPFKFLGMSSEDVSDVRPGITPDGFTARIPFILDGPMHS